MNSNNNPHPRVCKNRLLIIARDLYIVFILGIGSGNFCVAQDSNQVLPKIDKFLSITGTCKIQKRVETVDCTGAGGDKSQVTLGEISIVPSKKAYAITKACTANELQKALKLQKEIVSDEIVYSKAQLTPESCTLLLQKQNGSKLLVLDSSVVEEVRTIEKSRMGDTTRVISVSQVDATNEILKTVWNVTSLEHTDAVRAYSIKGLCEDDKVGAPAIVISMQAYVSSGESILRSNADLSSVTEENFTTWEGCD